MIMHTYRIALITNCPRLHLFGSVFLALTPFPDITLAMATSAFVLDLSEQEPNRNILTVKKCLRSKYLS